jgi:hypothetical protein
MTSKYNWENYEISLIRTSDSITIQILDTKLYKLYNKTYYDINIIEYCPNIDIFHTVLKTSFDALINDDNESAKISFQIKSSNLIIHIDHKYYIKFEFDIILDLDANTNLSAKDLCIKKLEDNLGTLTKKYNELEKFINDNMEVTICNCSFNHLISIKINTKDIIIQSNDSPTGNSTISYINVSSSRNMSTLKSIITSYSLKLDITTRTKFNMNFKLIKCEKLTFNNINHDIGFEYLPETLTEIIIEIKASGFKQWVTSIRSSNLKQLEFKHCSDLITIYNEIKHLPIKKIRMTGCSAFTERDLLLTNGYKFEVY